jgi:hypothetical protein
MGNGHISATYWMLAGLSGALITMISNADQEFPEAQAREF